MAELDSSMQYIGRHPYPIATWPLAGTEEASTHIEVNDIRGNASRLDLATEIRNNLQKKNQDGFRSFPSTLLKMRRATESPQQSLTEAEIRLLEEHADDIAMSLLPGTVLLELGTSSMANTKLLLEAFESHHKIVDYYALDMDEIELDQALKELNPSRFNYVRCHGLLGTHDDCRAWISKFENKQRPVCLLSLGSSMGSMARAEAAAFWGQWIDTLKSIKPSSKETRVIVGLGGKKDAEKALKAQEASDNSNKLLVRSFINNANEALGKTAFDPSDWTLQGEWDASEERHVQYLVPQKDIKFEDIELKAGEKVVVAHNHEYDEAEKQRLWQQSNAQEVRKFTTGDGSYGLHVLTPIEESQ